jgi:hypothetical protein
VIPPGGVEAGNSFRRDREARCIARVGDEIALVLAAGNPRAPSYGEHAAIPDRFKEETLTLSHASHDGLAVKLQVRAYDEGVALRYQISNGSTLTGTAEKTSFPVPTTTQVWCSTAAQSSISKVAIGSMGNGMERPLAAELASDLFAAFGEAGLRDHSRMKFSRSGTSTLVPSLASSWTYSGSFITPWRYVRLGDSPAALAQGSHFMLNLNDPSEVTDTSWNGLARFHWSGRRRLGASGRAGDELCSPGSRRMKACRRERPTGQNEKAGVRKGLRR